MFIRLKIHYLYRKNKLPDHWKYRVFGFNILSTIELPELLETEFEKQDVYIDLDKTPFSLEKSISNGVLFQANENEFLFRLDSVGAYYVQNGNRITVERLNDSTDEELRLFLLGSSFGALIHQNNLIPFHGSTVTRNGIAIIIGGASGSGKSTLAASLVKKGFDLLADDISVIDLLNKNPIVYPGIPHLKLWSDVLKEIGEDVHNHPRVRPQLLKYRVSLNKGYSRKPSPIGVIIIISSKNTRGFEIQEVKGLSKLKLLRDNIYRQHYIAGNHNQEQHFYHTSELASKVEVFHLQRPMHPLQIAEMTDFLLNEVKSISNDK